MNQRNLNRETIEAALDTGHLFIAIGRNKWWRCRRNGATKTWKRSPSRFRIPVKAGIFVYHAITDANITSPLWQIREDQSQ